MGSSGEPHDKTIDATVGGLVWVRRRNGSWWPGQIIEVDENSESFTSSPKSGTPIKLLGRDDVSVDWYNLEKSKRVKPFRCGEYDNCIEKAKLAAANSARKPVKYARREDAIICALEIEKENSNADLVKSSPAVSLSSKGTEHTDSEFSGFEGNNSSVHDGIEAPNQARHRRTPNDSEDEGVKRMRGLDDLGMGAVPAMKRKRSLMGHVHDFLKKKHRHRTLSKVLESTAVVANEPKRSSSVVINKNSDSIGVSSENRILGNAFGDASESGLVSSISAIPEKVSSGKLFDVLLVAKRTQPSDNPSNAQKPGVGAGGQFSQITQAKTVQLGNEELNESVSTSSGTADIGEKGESMWKSKGKRKSRTSRTTSVRIRKPFLKKTTNFDDVFDDSLDEYWGWSSRRSQKAAPQRSLPYRQSRFSVNPKYGPDFLTVNDEDFNSDLYDVNLEVKASTTGQHVPFISLMSKSTGRAIVGHPVTVEVVEEGSTDDVARKWNSFVPEDERKIGPKHLKSHRVSPIKSTRLGKIATSSKKIRKLSSLSGFSKISGEGARGLVAEEIMSTVVACIPLKVVFSRINACLRGSMRAPRRVVKPRKR